jgi:plasmid stabilization system protein ParE
VAYDIEWAESALEGLTEAVEYIARDSPSYAASLAIQADRAAASLSEMPHRGRRVREYHDPDVRELFVGKSYRLIYRVGTHVVSIIAFVHTARDLAKYVQNHKT